MLLFRSLVRRPDSVRFLHKPSIWDDKGPVLDRLFANNKSWKEQKLRKDPSFFSKVSESQHPSYLWIGCSDSRVPVEDITGLEMGEVFVHRNIANLVVNTDVNLLSVVQFAVENLKVKDIIVCGHYGCGGVQAATQNKDMGLLDIWLKNIRDVCRLHHDELEAMEDEEERGRRLVELNIYEQCLNLFKIGLIQRHQAKYGFPRIHGLVYDMRNGELKDLDVDFRPYIRRYRSIYKLHSFKSNEAPSRPQLQANMIRDLVKNHEEDNGMKVSLKFLTHAMQQEPELFSPSEIKNAIDASTIHDGRSVTIDDVVKYFER